MSLPAQALTKQKQFLGTVEARDEYGTWPAMEITELSEHGWLRECLPT